MSWIRVDLLNNSWVTESIHLFGIKTIKNNKMAETNNSSITN